MMVFGWFGEYVGGYIKKNEGEGSVPSQPA